MATSKTLEGNPLLVEGCRRWQPGTLIDNPLDIGDKRTRQRDLDRGIKEGGISLVTSIVKSVDQWVFLGPGSHSVEGVFSVVNCQETGNPSDVRTIVNMQTEGVCRGDQNQI